jgi:hypothetical protein
MTVKNAAMLIDLAVRSASHTPGGGRTMRQHREEFPALWQAIDELVAALKRERNYAPLEKETLQQFVKIR